MLHWLRSVLQCALDVTITVTVIVVRSPSAYVPCEALYIDGVRVFEITLNVTVTVSVVRVDLT